MEIVITIEIGTPSLRNIEKTGSQREQQYKN
jgi:hypothetical protein